MGWLRKARRTATPNANDSGHEAVVHSEINRRNLDFGGKRDGVADDKRGEERPPSAQGEPEHKPSGEENRPRPLLDKQVDYVLAAHGGPFDRAALEQALTQPSE